MQPRENLLNKKSAFTLIELLAIIIILAIIAVITVPIILSVIDNAKKGAAIDSAYGYLDSVNKHFVENITLDNQNDKLLVSYYVDNAVLKKFVGLDKKSYDISVNGNKPTSGFLKYDNYMATGYLIIDEYKIDIQDNKVIDANKYIGTPLNIPDNLSCNANIYANGTLNKEEYDLVCEEFINENIYTYTENADGTITITGFKDGVTDIVKNGIWAIPSEISGKSVSTIGSSAFASKNIVADVIIPNSVNVIENGVFQHNQITSIKIPKDTPKSAFQSNPLKTIIFKEGWENIPDKYMYNASHTLTNIIFPKSLKSIDEFAFAGNQITSIEIPGSVTSIGNQAFAGNQLTSIEIPKNTPKSVFESNPLKTMIFKEGWESILDGYAANIGLISIILPNSLKSIERSAFISNQLTSLDIPNGVTNIGVAAFYGNQIISLDIPNSVTSIGEAAFYGNKLTSLTFGKGLIDIHSLAFKNNSTLTTIHDNSDIQIFVNEYKNNTNLNNYNLSHFNSSNTEVSLYDKSGNIVNVSE